MGLKINGSTSGSIEIDVPAVAGTDTAITIPATDGGQFIVSDSAGDVNIDSGTFFVDASTDRCGIGTTSPADILHLSNAGDLYLRVANTSTSINAYLGQDSNGTYIGNTGSSAVRFIQGAAERARIDSSGRLLVGTSSARSSWNNSSINGNILQVERSGDQNSGGISVCTNAGTTSASLTTSFLNLGKSRGTTDGSNTAVASGDSLGRISFQGADGSEQVEAAKIETYVDGTPGSNDMPGRLVFSTTADSASSPTERMRIDQAGYIMLGGGATGQNGSLEVRPNNSFGAPTVRWDRNATSDGSTAAVFANNNNTVGSITYGDSSTAFNTSSDYRLKENVVDLDGAITRVKQLAPKRFNFIVNAGKTVDGFLAHEAQAVVPEAVTGTHDEVDDDGNAVMQGIDQSKLVPLLTAALQEAIGKIEALETANASLEARLTALEGGAS